jgi:Acyl-CoA synthetases (AMP-forming)/AMP-acid ligases II
MGYGHFEFIYAVNGIGAVCHTINPRGFADQIIYVINHAKDRIIFIDQTFVLDSGKISRSPPE